MAVLTAAVLDLTLWKAQEIKKECDCAGELLHATYAHLNILQCDKSIKFQTAK